jgi:hypothetical protein
MFYQSMKRIFSIIFLTALIFSCKPGVPKEVIQPDEMEKVLFDIHIVDGYINANPFPDSAKAIASAYYKGIYKKFDIDSATYTKSLDYYYAHPDVMKVMYEHISDKLAKARDKQSKIEMLEQKALAKADSIKRAKEKLKPKLADSIKQAKKADSLKLKKKRDSVVKDSIRTEKKIRNLYRKKLINGKRNQLKSAK